MPAPPYLNAFKKSAGRNGQTALKSIHYAYPRIPRPQRNPLYYYTASLKKGLSWVPQSKPVSYVARQTSAGLRYLPKLKTPNYGYRYYSSSSSPAKPDQSSKQKKQNKKTRRFLRWWTIPTVSIILWGVWKKKQVDDEEEERQRSNKPAKPWQVAAYSTLPLKAMSRLWGKFNEINLPVWMREPGFKLYSYVFGVNLDEVEQDDLTNYSNLGEFFYRNLKPGSRPIDENSPLVSPADGQVLHLGVINDQKVEQVKGITYRLDALLGGTQHSTEAPHHIVDFDNHNKDEVIQRDKNFAVVNGINYTLDDLIGDGMNTEDQGEAKVKQPKTTSLDLFKDLLSPDFIPNEEKELFFTVIYLAPGDYHRFHSPANWVSELRRHFVGELYSVAPYFQSRLEGLFCLNERVALLGRWKYGFFSMTPVGATNVGSIKLHFDKDLSTNRYMKKDQQTPTCYEATYQNASKLLGGYPLSKGQQMGGFNLGSTVVLVFEAPKSFKFDIKAGDLVKVGQSLGNC